MIKRRQRLYILTLQVNMTARFATCFVSREGTMRPRWFETRLDILNKIRKAALDQLEDDGYHVSGKPCILFFSLEPNKKRWR